MTAEQYLQHSSQTVTADSLSRLSELANLQKQLENDAIAVEEQLKKIKQQLADVSENLIPELMDEIGMSEFTTSTGLTVKVSEKVVSSISKENKEKALQWLVENGYSSAIKNEVKVSFGKEDFDKAMKLASDLRDQKLPALAEMNIHPSTLRSLVNNALSEGVNIPVDLFGIYRLRSTKIN